MPVLTPAAADLLEHQASALESSEIAAYLQEQLGQRMTAFLVGLGDSRQIGRYARSESRPSEVSDRRLREGYKVVRMIVDAFDARTAKAWLFGTNARLDDAAPIEVLAAAQDGESFRAVIRAARQFASFG